MLINRLGYSIPLVDLTEPKLKELKQILTVKPQVLEAYDYGQVKSFTMYRLSEKRIYIPKFNFERSLLSNPQEAIRSIKSIFSISVLTPLSPSNSGRSPELLPISLKSA